MKTFGEVNTGDTMYSLNHTEFGVLTEHTVSEVKRNKALTFIRINGYEKRELYKDMPDDEKYDLKIVRNNTATTGDVAPSIEGVKQYWIENHNDRIRKALNDIKEINSFILVLTNGIEKINRIK